MKMIIELDDNNDDSYNIDTYTHATGYAVVLDSILDRLRTRMKYDTISEEVYKELEDLRTFIYEQKQTFHLPND